MKFALYFLIIIGCASAQFNAAVQDAIVKFHNDLRSTIAKGNFTAKGKLKPPAANMLKIKWDPTIAASAQKFAEACKIGHSATDYGENVGYQYNPPNTSFDIIATQALKGWSVEFQGPAGWDLVPFYMGSGYQHASQMVWANTNFIGCGAKLCPNLNNYVAVVCQYSPSGNWFGQDVYQTGATCSACPSGSKCETSSGLCA